MVYTLYIHSIFTIYTLKLKSIFVVQNAQEHVFVVCEMRHTLDDINVRMLRTLARRVFRPPPHYNLAHFVQNAVCLFKVPAFSPAYTVRQMRLEHLNQRHALPVQVLQVTDSHVPLPARRCYINVYVISMYRT